MLTSCSLPGSQAIAVTVLSCSAEPPRSSPLRAKNVTRLPAATASTRASGDQVTAAIQPGPASTSATRVPSAS